MTGGWCWNGRRSGDGRGARRSNRRRSNGKRSDRRNHVTGLTGTLRMAVSHT
jgi:hypothetical protein